MGKHTPGAMRAAQRICKGLEESIGTTNTAEMFAIITASIIDEETAAPELLEALDDLAEAARNACDAKQHPGLTECLFNADAALTKATQ